MFHLVKQPIAVLSPSFDIFKPFFINVKLLTCIGSYSGVLFWISCEHTSLTSAGGRNKNRSTIILLSC